MKILSSSALALLTLSVVGSPGVSAFAPVSIARNSATKAATSCQLQLHNDNNKNNNNNNDKWFTNLAVACTFLASAASLAVAPPPAYADVELSTGAILIQATTTNQNGESPLGINTQLDAKSLLSTLFQNRKALAASVERIEKVIAEELTSPAVVALSKELLDLEGDVLPQVSVKAPRDWQQLLADVSKGKLNVIFNGEIINFSIDESFSQSEDEIVFRARGVKGIPVPGKYVSPEPTNDVTKQVRTGLYAQIDAASGFLNQPLDLPEGIASALPPGYVPKMSDAIVVGTVSVVGGSYAAAYSYYVAEQAAEAAAAEQKRMATASKKKKAAPKTEEKEEQEE